MNAEGQLQTENNRDMIEQICSESIEMRVNPLGMHRILDSLKIMSGDKYAKCECSVCLMTFEAENEIVPLSCNSEHVFHLSCLVSWANHNYTCPICRQPIIESAAEIAMYEMVN